MTLYMLYEENLRIQRLRKKLKKKTKNKKKRGKEM